MAIGIVRLPLIVSFENAIKMQIVPDWSALIDGFKVRASSIPASHSEMCKYKSTNTPGYQRTSGYIMNLVDLAAAKNSPGV